MNIKVRSVAYIDESESSSVSILPILERYFFRVNIYNKFSDFIEDKKAPSPLFLILDLDVNPNTLKELSVFIKSSNETNIIIHSKIKDYGLINSCSGEKFKGFVFKIEASFNPFRKLLQEITKKQGHKDCDQETLLANNYTWNKKKSLLYNSEKGQKNAVFLSKLERKLFTILSRKEEFMCSDKLSRILYGSSNNKLNNVKLRTCVYRLGKKFPNTHFIVSAYGEGYKLNIQYE